MASRRVPLANNPNAANSPFRAVSAAGTKRSRNYANDQREMIYGQPPPAKKQHIEVDDQDRRNVLLKKAGYATGTTSLTRKFEAVRDSKSVQRSAEKTGRAAAAASDNLETIRQWQKHYRKVFPQIVFYFESIPDDARNKISRQTASLGAREEKFFSKAVTHVVTTRPIPPELDSSSGASTRTSSTNHEGGALPKTVNPALLERTQDAHNQQRSRFTLEVASSKAALQMDTRKSGDILYKAREMGMKIWSLEKLQRMLATMLDQDLTEQLAPRPHSTRSLAPRGGRDADLSQMLRNEQYNAADLNVLTKDITHFRGYYIYIHDMDEKTKPVMMREYGKPATKEEGKWPQFRVTPQGRCPFVEDPAHVKKLQLEEQQKEAAKRQAERAQTRATRARTAALETAQQEDPFQGRPALTENNNVARRPSVSRTQSGESVVSKPLDPPKTIPSKRTASIDSMPLYGSAQANLRSMPRFVGGEPVASGIQPSNITSAIRSQMISSTAAAPGARATTSKEYQQLQRKVLEKNNAPSMNSMPSSHLHDLRAAINGDRGLRSRAVKRKATEPLAGIHEDMMTEEEEYQQRKAMEQRKKKPAEKELKPGYCENCREKFNDFDEHCTTRKHRKFAVDNSNWKELDALLGQLDRPLRDEE